MEIFSQAFFRDSSTSAPFTSPEAKWLLLWTRRLSVCWN